MNSVFSSDEISDSFWSPAMNRSSSEWAFERYLEELSDPVTETNPRPPFANSLTASAVSSTSVGSQSSTTKQPDGDDDVVEIKKPDFQDQHHYPNHQIHFSHPPPLDHSPSVPVDSDQYRAFLKTKLDLACAAVALARVYISRFLFLC